MGGREGGRACVHVECAKLTAALSVDLFCLARSGENTEDVAFRELNQLQVQAGATGQLIFRRHQPLQNFETSPRFACFLPKVLAIHPPPRCELCCCSWFTTHVLEDKSTPTK